MGMFEAEPAGGVSKWACIHPDRGVRREQSDQGIGNNIKEKATSPDSFTCFYQL